MTMTDPGTRPPTTPEPADRPLPLTDPDGYTAALNPLPQDLRDVLEPLQPFVAAGGAEGPLREVYVAVRLALDAWKAGDGFMAHSLALDAVRAAPPTPPLPPQGTDPGDEVGMLYSASAPWPRFPATPAALPAAHAYLHARAAARPWRPGDIVWIATDASWTTSGAFGYGYVCSTGLWGLRCGQLVTEKNIRHTYLADGKDPGPAPADSTLHELRAVAHLLDCLPRHLPPGTDMRLLIDNKAAQWFLKQWQTADKPSFPPGEHLMVPRNGTYCGVRSIARRVKLVDRLTVGDVRGHSGHLLNEAADTIAKLGRTYAQGREHDLVARGGDLAARFLVSWEESGDERNGGRRDKQRFV